MSTGPKLDGAGAAKMATLETALTQLQHMHGIVERMAVAVRANEPLTSYGPQLRRAGAHPSTVPARLSPSPLSGEGRGESLGSRGGGKPGGAA